MGTKRTYAIVIFKGDWSFRDCDYMPYPMAFIYEDGSFRLKQTGGNVMDVPAKGKGQIGSWDNTPEDAIKMAAEVTKFGFIDTGIAPKGFSFETIVHKVPEKAHEDEGYMLDWLQSLGLQAWKGAH